MAESVGRVIGDRYQIVGELGRGGMGVVYLGRDLWRDMSVAIKLCGREDANAMLWFKREFRVVASLRHPHLVELFELVAHERSYYFTMEHVAGIDPRRWTRPEADTRTEDQHETSTLAPLRPPPATTSAAGSQFPIDFSRVRAVLAQLAEGLAFLHGRGVIHRDIKPSNVLVANGSVKLLDFGLALDRQRIDGERARESNRLVGTPAYMAPEYLAQQTVTPAMDIFSLGVLACELVTGISPLKGIDLSSRPDVPPDLEQLILQMIDTNPSRRPTALEVATVLLGSMTMTRPSRRIERFVGRPGEIERITRVVADPAPRARVVVVRGPSGVGKTALVDEAIGRARIAGVLPELGWRGRCHERELVPYRAFDFIIDDLAAELIRVPELAATIEHAGALARGFPSLAPALPATAMADAAGDLRVERERALLAMTRLFELAIADQRAVVTIDDLQWADEDSIELLSTIVSRMARALTIVATWTDGDSASNERLAAILERLGSAVDVIALAPLGNVELAEIVAAAAPAAPIEDVRAAIAIAEGSPYLAELIARELAETGAVERSGAEARLLGRLAADERSIVELVAIALSGTTFEELRSLTDLPSSTLTRELRSLEDARVLKLSPSTSGESIYTCYHQRLRDAAHDAIATDVRRGLHLRVAEYTELHDGEPERLAHHYEHAGDPRAARWAIVAADDARAQLAWAVASDWYERAIALGETRCRQQLAECLFLGGKLAEAADAYERLADSAPDGSEKWRVRAAESFIKLGELERGLAVLDGVLERRGEPRARGRIASTGRTLAVMARWLSPIRLRATKPADEVLAAAYRVIASFLSTPYPIEAFEYVVRSVAIADRTGDRDNHATGMAMLAVYIAISSLGRYGDRAIAVAAQSGAPYPRMVAAGSAGILATIRGDWETMRRSHGEGHRICMKLGLQKSWEASFLRTYEALGEYYAGEPARAIAILDELVETSDDLFARALIGSYRARALLLAGEIDEARRAEHDVATARVAKRGLPAIYRQLFAAELALVDGEWARAESLGHELARHARAEWLGALPAVSAMIDVVIATAEIGRGDRASAERARSRARRLERLGRVSFYAVTALRLRAQAEIRLGNMAEATRLLDQAAAARVGSKLDRILIERLRGNDVDLGSLARAVGWSTGGIVY
jgi:serine/threonine protein kinase/tetratricopeptide (TPR) repeat protein